MDFLSQTDIRFLVAAILSVVCGFFIGLERESREKPAGISTNIFVCFGAALFTMISVLYDNESTTRIAANIVVGIGFLGAGIIIQDKKGFVSGLTTAAGIWFTAAVGMAIGFGWYFAAIVSAVVSVIIPRIPRIFHPNEMRDGKRRIKSKVLNK